MYVVRIQIFCSKVWLHDDTPRLLLSSVVLLSFVYVLFCFNPLCVLSSLNPHFTHETVVLPFRESYWVSFINDSDDFVNLMSFFPPKCVALL